MSRYFLALGYKGTNYSGFQVQENANTVQQEVEKALHTFYRQPFRLTGSSRTDSGVHALQNFFHLDTDLHLQQKDIYHLNAILPPDIACKAFYAVQDEAHCRFDALTREYQYFIHKNKRPFSTDRSWHYPFAIDIAKLHAAAQLVKGQHNFISFSKRNTQVNNFICTAECSEWAGSEGSLIYTIKANRFLRGMVRALVSSMLKVARGTNSLSGFEKLLTSGSQASADFSAPPHGLFLVEVMYPGDYMQLV